MAVPRATARQWKALGGWSKSVGARSATHLASMVLERTEQEIRATGLTLLEARTVIEAAEDVVRAQTQ